MAISTQKTKGQTELSQGKRLREYWSNEVDALLRRYNQFETLIPKTENKKGGSSSTAEDGRFIEALLRMTLEKFLPKELGVATGFILRPSVKTGLNDKSRRKEADSHSSQLDILIYDKILYPNFLEFENNIVVPPEGVIAIISVKKRLQHHHIGAEISALRDAAKLCRCKNWNNEPQRGPFLAVVSMESPIRNIRLLFNKHMLPAYQTTEDLYFDECVGYIGSLFDWSIFKTRPDNNSHVDTAQYIYLDHKKRSDGKLHIGLQLIITGILSVFYDKSRRNIKRLGFTAFEAGQSHTETLGNVAVKGLRQE